MCSDAGSASVYPEPSVARVHARTSSSLGVCRPFSSFDTFDGGQDSDSASCLPLRRACWRSSRSRLPIALRASWTFDTPDALFSGKGVPFYRPVPGSVAPVVVLDDGGRVLDNLAAEEYIGVVKMHPQQRA